MQRNPVPWERQLENIGEKIQQEKNKLFTILFLIFVLSLSVVVGDLIFLINFTFSTLELIAKIISLNEILKDTVGDPTLYTIHDENMKRMIQVLSNYEWELIEKINDFDNMYGIQKTVINQILYFHENGASDVFFRISDFDKVKRFKNEIFPINSDIKAQFYNTYYNNVNKLF